METPNDILESFRCAVCMELPSNSVECTSCGHIFCKICVYRIKCPLCRNHSPYKDSFFARKLINSIPVKCQNCNCETTKGNLESHLNICDERLFICKIKNCKKSFKKDEFFQHLSETHSNDIMNEFDEKYLKKQTDYFCIFHEKVNSSGNSTRRGVTGKFYCGLKSDINCNYCDGYCGPNSGCQCTDCMKVDIEFYKLPAGFIINHDGNFCQLIENKFYCGTRTGNSVICSPEYQNCSGCSKMMKPAIINYIRALIENNKNPLI